MCNEWLDTHSPQYSSLRSAPMRGPGSTPHPCSIAFQALVW